MFWAVLGNGSYFGLGSASAYVLGLFAVMTLGFVAANLPIVWSLPLAWRDRRQVVLDDERLNDDRDLWLWLLSAALSVAVGFRFFGHYYLQLLPPLCLLSAGALVRRAPVLLKATVALSAVIAIGFSLLGFWVKPWGDEPKYQAVSRYLDNHTSATDRIFVWGHMPEIYWAADRRPASRFLSSGFPVGDWGSRPDGDASTNVPTPGAYELMMADLHTQPPRVVLDTTPAAFRGSQYSPMKEYPALKALVDRDYTYVRTIDGIAIYERKPVPVASLPLVLR
jgi:hypothetical protein